MEISGTSSADCAIGPDAFDNCPVRIDPWERKLNIRWNSEYIMSFDQLGLRAALLKAVEDRGYGAPTPIQTGAIPVILGGRDILARAQTGTGKTDAFALPLVEILSRKKGAGRHPRALVLTPTRELALQVGESIKGYARRVSMKCTVVYGGVRIEAQINRLKRGIDILVATPGRLLDLAGQRHLKLSEVEFLVFDEADRMLDLGFSREISEILALLPTERRTMLFSATYTEEIRDLAARMLKSPEKVEVTPRNTTAESVLQKVHRVDKSRKRELLIHLLTKKKRNRILVFVRTKHGANKLTERLTEKGISAAALHSNKSQSIRTRTLKEFRNGEIQTLVATDVAARGLDISALPYVVNYDMPSVPEDYIHRIGRTGRAGERGVAVSLVTGEDRHLLEAIEKKLNQTIPVEKVKGYTEESGVPEFVIYRPESAGGTKKVDRELKQIVEKRGEAKKRSKTRRSKAASSGKSSGSSSRARSAKKAGNPGKKASRPGSRKPSGNKKR